MATDPASPATREAGPPVSLFEPILAPDDVLAATSAEAWVTAMLTFERELCAAEAEVGLVPAAAAEAVAAAADRLVLDAGELGRRARATGNPAVPLVDALRQATGPEGADAVHLGPTSQDVVDTAAMLVTRRAGELVLGSLVTAAASCAELADAHRADVQAGRTLLQQAVPVTFGLKAAHWMVGLDDAAVELRRVLRHRLAVQLGGAAGTLSVLGDRGPAVADRLAARLGLAVPVLPWHTDRGRVTAIGAALAGAAGAAGKVASDVVLLAQTEVAEVGENAGPGVGGSSTMPHKRNPVAAVLARAAALRAPALAGALAASMVQEHERAAGAWHAEWQTLTDLLRAAGGASANTAASLAGLRVDTARMRANLEAGGGVLLAERVVADLAPELGRARAAELVEVAVRRATEDGVGLRRALGGLAEITARRSPGQLDALVDPSGYLGATDQLVDRALAWHRALHAEDGEPVEAAGT